MKYILLYLLIFSTIFAKKLDDISLQLNWKYQFEFAGFIAAKEKGFYEDVGLNVTLKEYQFGEDVVDEVLNGNATFGVGSSSIIKDYLDGKPITLIASIFKKSALVIVSKPNIKKPQDLIDKTLMATKPDIFELEFMFEQQKINIDDIYIVPHSFNIKDFADGKVDAMSAYKSDQLYKLDKMGVKYNVLDPSDYGVYSLQDEIFTKHDFFDDHKDIVDRFKLATKKGWEYALEHKDELVDIIYKKYSKGISKDELRHEADIIEKIVFPARYEIGSIDKLFLEKQFKYFKDKYAPYSTKTLKLLLGEEKHSFELNKDEIQYLKSKKVIKVCYDESFYPISYTANNSLAGISKGILDLIEKQHNIKFDYIRTNDWIEQLTYLKQNRCDMTAMTILKLNSYKYIKPTKPYLSDQMVLVTKIDEPYISGLDKIKNKTIGIKYGFKKLKEILQKKYPTLKFVEIVDGNCNNIINGNVFGCITISLQASSRILKYYSNQLKVMTTIFDDEIKGAFGVSKRDPLLVSILNKSLKSIKKEDIHKIEQEYYNIKVEKVVDWQIVLYSSLIFVIILIVIIIFFIRERKFNAKLEKKIREAIEQTQLKDQQLLDQSRLAQMGEMISMIAHQWRQPLSAIGSVSISLNLSARMNKLDKKIVIEKTDKISTYVQHLSRTIDDFRDFFKPNKTKSNVTYNEIINSTLDIIEVSIINNNIKIIKDLNSEIILHTYPNDLKQVILNILKNAKDALLENNIHNPYIKISTYDNILTISDNAGGIKHDIIDKIFDPYFSTKSEKNGTGLGLYMSKMIIEEHCGGTISVLNSDEGAVFKIELKKNQ